MIRPCFNKLSSALRTAFDGMAKPIPCEPPLREMIAVLMPTISPRKLINGPPLLPGLIAALVCSKSPKPSLRFGRPFELMIPSVTVSSNPNGFPMARTKSPACTLSESASFSGLTAGSSIFNTARSARASVPDHARLFRPAIAQLQFDFVHLIDNVIVRDDVALVGHDDAGTKRILHHRFVTRISKRLPMVTEVKLEWVKRSLPPDRDLFGRLDCDN